MTGWRTLSAVTALGCAASGGALLVFSTFVATGLGRLPPAAGMAAMQQVNAAAPRSTGFMLLLFAPAGAVTLLGLRALVGRGQAHPALVVAAGLTYLVGVVGVTVAFHVPRNDALAVLDAATDSGGFHHWLRAWVVGNHVRTMSGLVSALLLTASLRCDGP